MATTKKKSALEEALSFVSNTANGVKKAFTPTPAPYPIKQDVRLSPTIQTPNFSQQLQNVSADYRNYLQAQQAQQAQKNISLLNVAKNIFNSAKTAATAARPYVSPSYYNPTKDFNPATPKMDNFWNNAATPTREILLGGQSFANQGRIGLGLLGRQALELRKTLDPGFNNTIRQAKLAMEKEDLYRVQHNLPALDRDYFFDTRPYQNMIEAGRSQQREIERAQQALPNVDYGHAVYQQLKNQGVDDTAAAWEGFKENTKHPDWWRRQLLTNLPQLVMTWGPAAAASAINPALGIAVVGATSYLPTSGQIYDEAKQGGADETTAQGAAVLAGIVTAKLESLGIEDILKRIGGNNLLKGTLWNKAFNIARNAMASTVSEGSTEGAQQLTQNAIAKISYDIDRNLLQGVPTSTIIGGPMGGVFSSVTDIAMLDANEKAALRSDINNSTLGLGVNQDSTTLREAIEEPSAAEKAQAGEVLGTQTEEQTQPKQREFIPIDKTAYQGLETANAVIRPDGTGSMMIMFQPGGQGFGQGTQLVGQIETALHDRGVTQVVIDAFPEATPFWQKMGYTPLTAVAKQGDLLVRMEKNLAPTTEQLLKPEQNLQDMVNKDIKQALTDTGNQLVPEEGTNTGPIDTRYDMTVDQGNAAIRGLFSNDEINFITNGAKDIVTPEGKVARGKYYDSVISVVEEGGKVESKTVYHEAFHAYADKFVDKNLYQAAIEEVRAQNEKLTEQQAVENLADGFADFMAGRQTFSGRVLAFFQDLLVSVRRMMGKESSANMIYQDIVAGQRNGGQPAMAPAYRMAEYGPTSPELELNQQPDQNIFLSQVRENPQEMGFEDIKAAAATGDHTQVANITQDIFNTFDKAFFPMANMHNDPVVGVYFGSSEGSNRVRVNNPADANVALYKALVMAKYNHQESVFTQNFAGQEHPNLHLNFNVPLNNQAQMQLANDISELTQGKFAGGSVIPGENRVQISYVPEYADFTPEVAVDLMRDLVVKLQEKGYQFTADADASVNSLIFNQNYDQRIAELAGQDNRVASAMAAAGDPDTRRLIEGTFSNAGHILSNPNEFWAAVTSGNPTANAQPQYRVVDTDQDQLALDALNQYRGYGPDSVGTPAKSDAELAMDALDASRGYPSRVEPAVVGEEVRPRSRRVIAELGRVRDQIQAQIQDAEYSLKHYNLVSQEEKLRSQRLTAELPPQVKREIDYWKGQLEDVNKQLDEATLLYKQHHIYQKYEGGFVSKKTMAEVVSNLKAEKASIEAEIKNLQKRPEPGSSLGFMSKKELQAHIKSLKSDLAAINGQMTEAGKDTRPTYAQEAPELTNQELGMQQLENARKKATPEEQQQEPVAATNITTNTVSTGPVVEAPSAAPVGNQTAPVAPEPIQVNNTPPEAGQKKRGFVETVEQDQSVPKTIREQLAQDERAWYGPIANQAAIDWAKNEVATNHQQIKEQVLSDEMPKTGEEMARLNAAAFTLAREAILKGDNDLADEIIMKTAEKGTYFGQGLQSFAIWQRLTPEGMLMFAKREVANANKKLEFLTTVTGTKKKYEISENVRDQILAQMREVEKMPDGLEKQKAIANVMELIAKQLPLSTSEIFDAYRYQNILSNPLTHLRNIIGNSWNTFVLKPVEDTVAAGFDIVGSTLTGKARQNYFQLPTYYRGMLNSFHLATQEFWDALRGQVTINQPDLKSLGSLRSALNTPWYLASIPRLLEGADRFFTTMIRSGETAAVYERGEAALSNKLSLSRETLNDGFNAWRALSPGERFTSDGIKKVADKLGIKEETAGTIVSELNMMEEASNLAAQKYLFRNDIDLKNKTGQGWMLTGVDHLTRGIYSIRKGPIAWWIPFIKTPMNVAKMQLEYSPLGIFTLPGSTNKSRQLAKTAIGTAITMWGASLAALGRTTWEAPLDEKEKELYYATGRRPYSVLLWTPFGDKWVPMQQLGVYGLAVAIPAAIHHYQEDNKTALSDDQMAKIANISRGLLKYYTGQTYLEGLDNFVKTVTGENDYTMGGNLAYTLGQFIPLNSMVAYVSRVIDPVYRKIGSSGNLFKDVATGMQRDLPWLSTKLPAYTTPTGQPSTRDLSAYVAPYTLGTPTASYEGLYQERQDQVQTNNRISAIQRKAERETAAFMDKMGVGGTGGTSLNEKNKLDLMRQQANKLMDTYMSSEDPTIRKEIESTLNMLGMDLEDAMGLAVEAELKPKYRGLNPTADAKLKRSGEFDYVRKMLDKYGEMPQAQDFITKTLGQYNITAEDMIYDDKTLLPDDVQLDEIKDEIKGLTGQEKLAMLLSMKVISEGSRKALLTGGKTSGLVKKLVDQNIITEDEADLLDAVEWDSASKSFVKVPPAKKKISKSDLQFDTTVPKARTVSFNYNSVPGASLVKMGSYKAPRLQQVKLQLPADSGTNLLRLHAPKVPSGRVSINAPVTTLSGLGRIY